MDVIVGYQNSKSNCYFNALLQALGTTRTFRTYLGTHHPLLLKELVLPTFSQDLLSRLPAPVGQQESASEYLHHLVEFLDKGIPEDQALFNALLYSHQQTQTCLACKNRRVMVDKTTCLLLHENLIELFKTENTIDGYNCEHCKNKVSLLIESQLCGMGSLIIVSLNKYSQKKKFNYQYGFSVNGVKWELVATIEHFGTIQGGGHYTARIKKGNKYYAIDDEIITELTDLFNDNNTYMLFYERVN